MLSSCYRGHAAASRAPSFSAPDFPLFPIRAGVAKQTKFAFVLVPQFSNKLPSFDAAPGAPLDRNSGDSRLAENRDFGKPENLFFILKI
ncbi:MAG: hypothetical protein JO269_07240 [Burkholderiaceae bacterium]|nr:hypothetical protein [Burkholderiaceae bacterium]